MRFGLEVLLLAAALSGCAVNPTTDVNAFAANSGGNSFEVFNRNFDSPDALVLPVIHDRQTEGPACGAHALASIVNYWRGPGTLNGSTLFHEHQPQSPAGYSMAEVTRLATDQGLLASAVRLSQQDVIRELENGRPVMTPVRIPSIYIQRRVLRTGDLPVIGLATNALVGRAARVSEWSRMALLDHYLVVVGYHDDTFVVVEPVMGYRTIRFDRLERYRRAFDDAALVFSRRNAASAQSHIAATENRPTS
jgi:predicted double-glycine peptidase